MVGYQNRFDPCYKILQTLHHDRSLGRIISGHFEWGTYLPAHHPYEDYREGYAARKDLGGGVVLGLIHELDSINNLFGYPENIAAVSGSLSDLELDVEDTVSAIIEYAGEAGRYPISLFLSYAQTKETRRVRLQYTRATVLCDFVAHTVRVYNEKGEMTQEHAYPSHERNQLFIDELHEFLSAVRERRDPMPGLTDGISSLTLALQIKEALDGKGAR